MKAIRTILMGAVMLVIFLQAPPVPTPRPYCSVHAPASWRVPGCNFTYQDAYRAARQGRR